MKYKFFIIVIMSLTLLLSCNESKGSEDSGKNDVENNQSSESENMKQYNVDDEVTLDRGLKDYHMVKLTDNIDTEEELVMEGDFTKTSTNKTDYILSTGRMLNLDKYKLKTPKLTIKSKDTTINDGTFIGDIYVGANGLVIDGTTVKGNVYFMEQQFKDSFKLVNDGKISGEIEIK